MDNRVLNLKDLSVFQFRSLAEVVTCLHKARRREYISEAEFKEHYEFAFQLNECDDILQRKDKIASYLPTPNSNKH